LRTELLNAISAVSVASSGDPCKNYPGSINLGGGLCQCAYGTYPTFCMSLGMCCAYSSFYGNAYYTCTDKLEYNGS